MNLPANSVNSNPWSFDDSELLEIKTKLLKQGKFGDYAKGKVGIQALWDRAYHIKPLSIKKGIITGKSFLKDKFKIELDACRPLICNENFYPFRNDSADAYVIFPYDIFKGSVREIKYYNFKKRYPQAGEYLSVNKKIIRESVETWDDINCWHLFTRVQNHGATYPKVLVPMTALDTFASVSFSDKTYCDNANVFFIEIPIKNKKYLYALASIINSTIFSVLARSIANPQSKGYFKFNKQFLEPIPFPVKAFKNEGKLVSELSDISQSIEKMQNKYIKSSPSQKKTLKKLLNSKWSNLDNIVYRLYGLTDKEMQLFNKRGRNINRLELLG